MAANTAERTDIVLVSGSPMVRQSVTEALDANGRFMLGTSCATLEDLQVVLRRTPKDLVLVDIDPDPSGMLAGIETMSRTFPQTRFLVLAKEFRSDLAVEAMQAGVRHFLVKNLIASELASALKRLMPEVSGSSARGRVVSFLSASGGAGATTLAINLAHELGLLAGDPSLLIDLDAHYGAVATYLGLRGQFGVADVLSRHGDIDAQLIRTTAQTFSDQVHVLISPATTDVFAAAGVSYARLEETLRAAAHAYKHVVVDGPRIPMGAVAGLVAASDIALLVFQLTVKDITMVRRYLTALADRGVSEQRVILLANRYRKRRTMIALKEASDALDGRSIISLENDYPNAVGCINYGRLLASFAPRSPLRRGLKELADKIFSMQPRQTLLHGTTG